MNNMTKSSEIPPPATSFSIPYDITLNILARVSRNYHSILSLVSKSFRSILSSRELYATRTLIGNTENVLYVCLNMSHENPNPRWFTLSLIPKRQNLVPIPLSLYKHPENSTAVSIGSEIYIIGGFIKRKRKKSVFLLDCRTHQWLKLRNMSVARAYPCVDVTDGKIHIHGGCSKHTTRENWTETYEPFFSKTPLRFSHPTDICYVEINKNRVFVIELSCGRLYWFSYENQSYRQWIKVTGLEGLSSNLYSMTRCGDGRRVLVWWKTVTYGLRHTKKCNTEIWCAEISFERRGEDEICGLVEWSKSLFTFDGCDSASDFLWHSVIVTL